MRAGYLSDKERLQTQPEPLRLLMDTLRVIAYHAETAMATAVSDGIDNPDTARSLFTSLSRGNASLRPDEPADTRTVFPNSLLRLMHES